MSANRRHFPSGNAAIHDVRQAFEHRLAPVANSRPRHA
jgi:hypothetical protein